MGERRVMEARESNEHIDLMRLIVMQLISAPAPVTKMKGLQLSEINWDLPPPPPHTPLFLSQPRQFGHVSEGFGRQRISAVSCLCLSTCQPPSLSPTLLSLRLQELSHTKGRFLCWIQVGSAEERRRSLAIYHYHASRLAIFIFTIAGRAIVVSSDVQIHTGKKEISREIKFADVWKRCFCGAFD